MLAILGRGVHGMTKQSLSPRGFSAKSRHKDNDGDVPILFHADRLQ